MIRAILPVHGRNGKEVYVSRPIYSWLGYLSGCEGFECNVTDLPSMWCPGLSPPDETLQLNYTHDDPLLVLPLATEVKRIQLLATADNPDFGYYLYESTQSTPLVAPPGLKKNQKAMALSAVQHVRRNEPDRASLSVQRYGARRRDAEAKL